MGTIDCIILENGTRQWYIKGKLHREDGPAIEWADGTRQWHINGELHREDGPAIEWADGTREWYINGERHREDGPAIELADGTRQWRINGELHREDGPAIEWADGTREWYRKGYPYGIAQTEIGIHIGCKTKPTVGEWDEWFSGTEEYENPRNSPEFKTLQKLWAQFKAQHAK